MSQPTVLDATRHGLLPHTGVDSGPLIRRLIEQVRGPTRLVLAPGRYDLFADGCTERVYPLSNTGPYNPRRCAVLLHGQRDLVLDLQGVDLRCHGRLMPLTVEQCERVTVVGGTIDWDFPLTAQAEVVAATPEALDLQIDTRHHPFSVRDGRVVFAAEGWVAPLQGLMEFDPVTGHIPPGSADRCAGPEWWKHTAEDLGGGRVRLHGRFLRQPAVGHVLVMRHNPRDHAGVFIYNSEQIAFNGLALRHTSGLGILCQHSADLSFTDVNVTPSAGRMFSGHDDGLHVSNCRGHIAVDRCRFAGLMDDPINVHGTTVRVHDRLGPDRLRCRFMHHESVGLAFARPGDTVSFLDRRTLRSVGQAQVRAIHVWDVLCFDLTFDQPVPADVVIGDALENLTWSPDVTIADSFFGCCRARGLLVSTPGRVRIHGNRFESSGSAILIAGDANQWYEAGAVRDVLIRGNVFADICNLSDYQFTEAVISIYPEIPHPDPAYPFHRNIRIEDNEFHLCDYPVLYAKSTDHLAFTGNRLVRSHRFAPRHPRRHLISLEYCQAVSIGGNRYEGEVLGRDVACRGMAEADVTVDAGEALARVAL